MYGRHYLSALLRTRDAKESLDLGRIEHLFKNTERDAYRAVRDHVVKHGALPTRKTLALKLGENLPKAAEPPSYYRERMQGRYVTSALKRAADDAQRALEAHPDAPEEALDGQLRALLDVKVRQHGAALVDYRDAADLLLPMYARAQTQDGRGIPFGWPHLDSRSAGIQDGDLVSFVGRPAAGKTFLLLWAALHAWRSGRRALFVTMEMKPALIFQRLSAIDAKTPVGQIMRGQLPKGKLKFQEDRYARWRDALFALKDAEVPLWVLDGDLTATGDDLRAFVAQLHPDVVYVDGAYLLRHPDARLGFYQRITDNCHQLKTIAGGACPVVASWQFNREATKLRKGQRAGLEHVADTDAVGKDSSLVIGAFQEDSPETLARRRLDVVKGRHGQAGSFHVRWDFHRMDFSEAEEGEGELSYL